MTDFDTLSGSYVILTHEGLSGAGGGPWLHGPYADIERVEDHAAALRVASARAVELLGWDELNVFVMPTHVAASDPIVAIAEHCGPVDLEGYGLDEESLAAELSR